MMAVNMEAAVTMFDLALVCTLMHFLCCSFEDYVGQLEAATAVAGLSAEKERAPAVKDRKELAAIQEV